MNRLPLVLITLATATAFALCARAQTRSPRVVLKSDPRVEERGMPDAAEDPAAEKARLKFEGLRFLNEADALMVLREGRTGVSGTFDYDPAKLKNAIYVLKKFYAARGFVDAAFEVREETGEPPRLFTIVVDEGERARLEEIRFEGGRRVNGVRLEEAAHQCLARMAGEGHDWRDAYEYDRLEWCAHEANRRRLVNEGFLEAKAGHPKVEAFGRGLRATVQFEEGTRYRCGKIRVKGVTAFLPEQIVEMLDVRVGEVVNGGKIMNALSVTLSEEYGERGFLQYAYDVTPTYRETPGKKGQGVVDFKIEIIEGKSFTLSSISFSGNRLKTVDELRAALSVREGDVFGHRRFADGLQRLYEIGALGDYGEETFPDSWPGVELKLDEEKGLVEVFIQVREPQYSAPTVSRPR